MSEEREHGGSASPELERIRTLLDEVNELVAQMAGDISEEMRPKLRYFHEFGVSDGAAEELVTKMNEVARDLVHIVPLAIGDIDIELTLSCCEFVDDGMKRDVLVSTRAGRVGTDFLPAGVTSIRRESVESS